MYSLNTNIDALNARNASRVSSNALSQSLKRLSTGIRINSSADDSAGLIEANRLRSDSGALKESIKNANNTIAMFQIIDKALDQQINLLDNIRAKSIQASTDGQSKITREALQTEIEGLLKELDNIAKETSFGNQKLLDGTFFNKKVNIGKDSSSLLNFSFNATSSDKMGFSSYKTTEGGERLISDLSLTFKNTGISNEDVTLAPFTLSTSPGKTIVDLANFVNKYTENTGVRAIYKEGNTLPIYKRKSLNRDLLNEAKLNEAKLNDNTNTLTTSSYIEKDFPTRDRIQVSNISFASPLKVSKEPDLKIEKEDLSYNIDFRASTKPNIITPAGKTFYESVDKANYFNNNTLSFQLTGDEFTTINPSSAISVSNLPDYLQMNFARDASDHKVMRLTITPKTGVDVPASFPTGDHIINNIGFNFTDPKLFQSKIVPDDINGFALKYKETPASNLHVIGNFRETSTDDGTYGGKVTLELQGGIFDPTVAIDDTSLYFNTAGAGLDGSPIQSLRTIDNNKLEFTLSGKQDTDHGENDDKIIDLRIVNYGIFEGTRPSNNAKTYIDFADKPIVEFRYGFTEHSDNDGTISTSIILRVNGDKFKDNLTKAQLEAMINIEYATDKSNLEIHYNKTNSNEIRVTYAKKANDNMTDIDITKIEFNPLLFEREISSPDITNAKITFLEDPNITINTSTTSFKENSTNPGEVNGSLVLDIEDGKASFTTTNIKDYIDISLPDGLTPSFTISNANQTIAIALDGTANDHSFREEDISVGFKREAFQPNVFSTKLDSHIDFFDSAYVVANDSFKEDGATNDGTISNIVNLFLKNGEKLDNATTTVGTPLLATDYVVSDLPVGLVAVLTPVDDENISVTLTGKADPHINSKNISITLKGNILESKIDTIPADIRIEFKKASRIIQIGELRESAANNGTITSKATFELTDGTFNDNPDVTTLPDGLTAQWTRDTTTPNIAVLELTGEVPDGRHQSYQPGDVVINFKDSIVGNATDTIGLDAYRTKVIFVDDLPEFTKLGGNFTENEKNTGQISGQVGLSLPSEVDFATRGYNLSDQDEINIQSGISLKSFLRQNIIATNLPFILETDYKLDPLNPKRILVSFLQNDENLALSHSPSDDTSFRLSFKPPLFVGDANVRDVSLDIKFFDEPEVIAFGGFQESPRNDGSTDDYIELSVLGDKFARVNPNNYIKVNGIPSSLIPRFVTDKSSIRFYLDGKSQRHDEFDDFNKIELVFDKRLFENQIEPVPLQGLRFDFRNKPVPELTENFQEAFSNDGSIDKPLTVELKDGYFKTTVDPSDYIRMSKVPAGLKARYRVIDETSLEVTLRGNAFNHSLSESVTEAELEIDAGMFVSGIKPDKVENIGISFLGSPKINYSGGFIENEVNDGTVSGTVTLNLEKDTFREGLELDNYIILGNLPVGLTPIYRLRNDTTIEFTLQGRALNHTDYNDLDNLSVSFTSDLFKQQVLPSNEIEDIQIDFKDSPKVFYNDYFRESSKNDGSIRNIITLDLFGDNLTSINPNATGVIKVTNVPTGLTPLFARTKANQLTMQLLGQSANHSALDAISNVGVEFTNQLFRNGVAPVPLTDILIDYRNRPTLSSTDPLTESSFNDGSFREPMTINLTGDTFNDGNNPNNNIFVKNLPAGLNPKFTILNDSQIELRLEGNALEHDDSSIKPELVFQDPELFFSGIAPDDFILRDFNFVEAPLIELSGPFTESFLNDGTISNTVSLSIKNLNDKNKFKDINSNDLQEYISISNLPSGLEPIFVKVDDEIQITLRGSAIEHTNLYDVDNLRLEFSQELFESGVSGNIIDNGIINFREPPKVSTRSFVESDANDGSISTSVTLSLGDDDNFTGVNLSENIRVISPPNGLTPVFRTGNIAAKEIVFTLTGNADDHENIHDLDNMTLEFDPSLFDTNQKADPITNMVVDFKDPPPPVVEANENIFEEAEANDGSIEESIDFTIKYDKLSKFYEFKYTSTINNVKDIIGNGNNVIFNGVNIPNLDVNSPDFYTSLVEKINNKGNGTGGLFAELDGVKIKVFKDFENTITIEGNGSTQVINNDAESESIKREFLVEDMLGHLIDATGVPQGLNFEYERKSDTLFSVTLQGNAIKHLNRHDTDKPDIEDLKFRFKAGLFTRNVDGKDLNDVSVNFNDPTVEFSDSFKESKLDDGSIGNKITITLFGDTFNDETRLEKFIKAKNIPKGLSPVFTRLSDKEIEMSLEGNATNHLDEHDINNITLSFAKELFSQGLAIFPTNKLSINFNDPPDPVYVPGGPGAYGGYLTFISDRSSDLIIDSGDADFGVNDSKYSTTLNLRDAVLKDLNRKDLYGTGYTDDIDYALHEKSIIKGVNHKQSASLVMDAVDSALEYLKKMRAKVASYQIQVEKRLEYLSIERTNIISAESTIREIDFAEETSNFQKRNLLTQAGNYAISQANASKKMILSLLQQS